MDREGNDNNADIPASHLHTFRIFLASPGDVPLERKLARETIKQIGNERRFRDRIKIDITAWDQPGSEVAMEAGLTPQEAISQGLPKPEACDLALIILWSRIGTPLPTDFELKADGSPYLSGTEWEFLNAMKGFKQQQKPTVWIYRREEVPKFSADDGELANKLEQWNKVKAFFDQFTNPDNSIAGGVNHYHLPDDFRQRFERHLRDRLDKVLENLPDSPQSSPVSVSTRPVWTESPYPGLAAFTPDQAPIFFGRGEIVDQLMSGFSQPGVRFVAVVGASGSGKSSLVMAGLLPRLRSGIIGNAPWTDLRIKPGERGGDPFLALAYMVRSELDISSETEQEIARQYETDPQSVSSSFANILGQKEPGAELLLLIDQFEELFTQAPSEKINNFADLLAHLIQQPRLRVIITLRADFYAQAADNPVLAALLRHEGKTYPLSPPGMAALHEMVVRPAEAAGVELEDGLAQRLLDEAGSGPGALSLIAYTLNRLYEEAPNPRDRLTITAYEAFGGVQGAVEKRAETALIGLPVNLDRTLPRLFNHLVEVNEQEVATRRRAPQNALDKETRTIARALTEARLLIGGEGEAGQPTWEVAHEIVLTGWTRLRDWIAGHAESLRARRDLERAAAEWGQSNHSGSALRTGQLLQRYLKAAEPHSPRAQEYLRACKTRRNLQRIGFSAVALLLVSVLGLLYQLNQSDYGPSLAAKALFVHWGLLPLTEPEMVTIPMGEFQRGSVKGDSDERPVVMVKIASAFQIAKYEVTFEEYDLFAAATGRDKPNDQGWGRGSRPVINVSWEDAEAYAAWLSSQTGKDYRLPSEAEWEYAARAGTETERYWPNHAEGEPDPACNHANVFDTQNASRIKATYGGITWEPFNCGDDYPFTAPVGQFTPNGWQLHDMLGNVWEWVRDCYVDSYEGAPTDGTPREVSDTCEYRVLRGGSWFNIPRGVRSANREGGAPDYRSDGIGFRLARTN
jgi:formylglycine-generating enzyme required for sulfatase activity